MLLKPRIDSSVSLPTNLHPALAYIYKKRDILDIKELDFNLSLIADPKLLYGAKEAASVIYQALTRYEKIVIVGDFDVDGATSTALLMRGFLALGINNIDYIIPDRFDDGYGLTQSVVDKAKVLNADLIITVDNGISAHAAIDYANQHGIKVIITDHHLAPEILPNAVAIINPQQAHCNFPSKNLSGVGVAFYLLLALRAHLRIQKWFEAKQIKEFNLAHLLDLVALGTIADIVPLDHNNRILVQHGLERIRKNQCIAGINALLKVIGKHNQTIGAQDIGFQLAPRLNAAGRMDNMAIGVELLLTDDPNKADEIALLLNDLNLDRKNVQKQMQDKAMQLLDQLKFDETNLPNSIVIFHEDFHEGVIGLLSSRLKDRYYRPVFSFAQNSSGILKGSGRSISGVHLRNLLETIAQKNKDLIITFGGHAMAAGLTIAKENLPVFQNLLEQCVTEQLQTDTLIPIIETDGEPPSSFFNYETAKYLKLSLPWGAGFPEPLFQGIFTVIQQRLIGSEKNHLKLLLANATHNYFDALLFNCNSKFWSTQQAKTIQITYHLEPNEYQNQKNVNLLIQDIEIIN